MLGGMGGGAADAVALGAEVGDRDGRPRRIGILAWIRQSLRGDR